MAKAWGTYCDGEEVDFELDYDELTKFDDLCQGHEFVKRTKLDSQFWNHEEVLLFTRKKASTITLEDIIKIYLFLFPSEFTQLKAEPEPSALSSFDLIKQDLEYLQTSSRGRSNRLQPEVNNEKARPNMSSSPKFRKGKPKQETRKTSSLRTKTSTPASGSRPAASNQMNEAAHHSYDKKSEEPRTTTRTSATQKENERALGLNAIADMLLVPKKKT